MRVYIKFFWKGDHTQTIMRAAKMHMLHAKEVSVQFETEEPEHPLQAPQSEAIVAVRGEIDGVS